LGNPGVTLDTRRRANECIGSERIDRGMLGRVNVDPLCVFCRIVSGSEPARLIYEDPNSVAFLDVNPASEGHALVVPRSHARTLLDIDPERAGATMVAAVHVARLLDRVLAPDGMTLVQTNEPAGGQSVFHVHLHLVPRWDGDDLVEPWKATHADDGVLDALRSRILAQGG
jgi:histidine triad (HIT) family protein